MSPQKLKRYIYIFKKLTSCIHHIINIFIYLYYMYIKDYFTYPKNIELKEISDEKPENHIENCYENLK
jgi:hypothetical protein